MKNMKKLIFVLSLFLFTNCAYSADSFVQGVNAYNNKQYVAAERYFAAAVSQHPNDVNIRYWYCQALIRNKDISKAKENYQVIIKQSPNSQTGKYARQGLELLEKQIKTNTSMNYQYGENDYLKSAYKNNKLYRFKPGAIKVYIPQNANRNLTMQAFNEWQNKTSKAVSFIFVQDPRYANINVNFVDKINTKSYNNAFEAGNCTPTYEGDYITHADMKILTVDKNGNKMPSQLLYNIILHETGHAIGLLGHSTNPADIMSTASGRVNTQLSARDIRTAQLLYKGYVKKDETAIFDAKIAELRNFADKVPSNPNSWIDLGNEYYKAQKYKEAVQEYKKAVDLKSRNFNLYLNLSDSYFKLNDFTNSAIYSKTAVDIDPKNVNAEANLLAAYYKLGKHSEAKAALKYFLKINPNQKNNSKIIEYVKYYGL